MAWSCPPHGPTADTKDCPALDPAGRRKRGRPKTTWRRTVASGLKDLGLSWGQAQHLARNRQERRRTILALCPTKDEEA